METRCSWKWRSFSTEKVAFYKTYGVPDVPNSKTYTFILPKEVVYIECLELLLCFIIFKNSRSTC